MKRGVVPLLVPTECPSLPFGVAACLQAAFLPNIFQSVRMERARSDLFLAPWDGITTSLYHGRQAMVFLFSVEAESKTAWGKAVEIFP